ncbi:MAG: isoprenyl transferase [Dysgonamonadaceae bacterium]|jgi:undecaprenyl diphosphate synthase|nr:isoprenyl transferase [Dysgonamonadaceae bacterium]
MSLKEAIDLKRLPVHIAVIMDGNGRWAQENGMERFMGHKEGVISVRKIVEAGGQLGIKYLTVYTFSTENWNRPKEEVDALMALMVTAVRKETKDLMANNVRLRTIGDVDRLPPLTRRELDACIDETKNNTGLNLVLALSYSSKWELTEAVRKIVREVKDGTLPVEQISEQTITDHLTTKDIPDPDLLIRTGGEFRISNYLLWQAAYAELYFTDTYWPDFREENLYAAIVDYQKRERRFGKTGEQIQLKNRRTH